MRVCDLQQTKRRLYRFRRRKGVVADRFSVVVRGPHFQSLLGFLTVRSTGDRKVLHLVRSMGVENTSRKYNLGACNADAFK